MLEMIKDWINKDNICCDCGSDKSVKYIKDDETYCNKCILKAMKNIEGEFTTK